MVVLLVADSLDGFLQVEVSAIVLVFCLEIDGHVFINLSDQVLVCAQLFLQLLKVISEPRPKQLSLCLRLV